jgi:prolyl-tRNA synthetase
MSKMLMATLREVPAEAEIQSHKLMLRAGLMRKLAAGIYSYLPLGYKTLRKVEQIVREEMDAEGAQEVLMSALLPAETYKASGRWEVFGPEMFRLVDRNERDFCLGPTHEEVFTETVKNEVKSYKQLPLTLYQIQTKYRDERRPRFGVMRSREFIMKDAYSFDLDLKGLDESYNKMYKAYCKAFERMGMDYIVVDADSGAMGGSGSQEFMVKSEVGEGIIAYCDNCGFSANDEKASCIPQIGENKEDFKIIKKIETPNVKTIEDLEKFFNCSAKSFAKTLIYKADDKIVAAMVRGDRELNETKLQNYLNCIELEMADPDTVAKITNAEVGFAGPIGLDIDIIVDPEVEGMVNFIVGANETGYHYINVNINKDFKAAAVIDIRNIVNGDSCPVCKEKIKTARGIEVGHIFKLGTKYSEALGCKFLDSNGKEQVAIMGCYGIGINRCMAAVIEQNSDENGIIWPVSIAPYEVIVIPVQTKNEEQMKVADEIYEKLKKKGIDVIIDDRDERPGVKFKDADLIGFPIRITVGKKVSENIVEYKLRREKDICEKSVENAINSAVDFTINEK